jgi:outer membrane protein OmpA-like peptidoglycan-associated protein
MLTGTHFTPPAGPPHRRLRRTAGLVCGAVAIGATALLVVEVTSGSSKTPTLSLASSPASAHGPAATSTTMGASSTSVSTSASTPVRGATTSTTVAPPVVLPDGSPVPVLVVFNGDTITLAGAVPTQAAADRLRALAIANSKSAAQVIDNLVVDARVPASVGVRVIEMNAIRFAEGSTVVTPEYAPELARVVNLMRALPSVTVTVIGHADQTGPAGANLQLSQDRATAVIEYLVAQGISPDRLSGQGVGARDLLTTQSSTSGLALNRRTEFVFYGLLASTAR